MLFLVVSFLLIFTGIYLIYKVTLVHALQQSESDTHKSTLFIFISDIGHYRVLSTVPSAVCVVVV